METLPLRRQPSSQTGVFGFFGVCFFLLVVANFFSARRGGGFFGRLLFCDCDVRWFHFLLRQTQSALCSPFAFSAALTGRFSCRIQFLFLFFHVEC